jgi:hypothetical protein
MSQANTKKALITIILVPDRKSKKEQNTKSQYDTCREKP